MKLTVVTPALNSASTIRACIESVRSQDYPDIEHLVIDGGSTDGTLDIVKSYGITYTSEHDAGIYDAFNKGVRAASGTVVHILNSDDQYAATNSASTVMAYMNEHNLDLCHGYAEQVTQEGELFKRIGKDLTKKELLAKMRAAHPATFVTKSVYTRYGDYSVGFKVAADHDFMLRVWDRINIGFIPQTLVRMQIGGISTSQFVRSYRESMAAAIINGQAPLSAYIRYSYEIAKNSVLRTFR